MHTVKNVQRPRTEKQSMWTYCFLHVLVSIQADWMKLNKMVLDATVARYAFAGKAGRVRFNVPPNTL